MHRPLQTLNFSNYHFSQQRSPEIKLSQNAAYLLVIRIHMLLLYTAAKHSIIIIKWAFISRFVNHNTEFAAAFLGITVLFNVGSTDNFDGTQKYMLLSTFTKEHLLNSNFVILLLAFDGQNLFAIAHTLDNFGWKDTWVVFRNGQADNGGIPTLDKDSEPFTLVVTGALFSGPSQFNQCSSFSFLFSSPNCIVCSKFVPVVGYCFEYGAPSRRYLSGLCLSIYVKSCFYQKSFLSHRDFFPQALTSFYCFYSFPMCPKIMKTGCPFCCSSHYTFEDGNYCRLSTNQVEPLLRNWSGPHLPLLELDLHSKPFLISPFLRNHLS